MSAHDTASKRKRGRPKGSKNKTTLLGQQIAQRFIKNRKGLKKMKEQYEQGTLHPSLVQMFFHYGCGKPKDVIELTDPDGKPVAYNFVVTRASDKPRDAGD
jgi:hypothetical protein